MPDNPAHMLLEQVCRGIAANRHPGLHFPGYFLGLHALGMDASGARTAIPYGPHCANANGDMNLGAIALLADMGLGAAMRMHVPGGKRMATTALHLHLTGVPARTDLVCESRFDGFVQGASATLGHTGGRLLAGNEVIAQVSGSFATPPAPEGVTVHPVPWDHMGTVGRLTPLPPSEMREDEKTVLKAARAAVKASGPERAFIEHFWAQIARPRTDGADQRVKLGPHVGNRVGHTQGGVLFGIAAATATAAIPRHSRLTGASAWYISAGTGKRLRVRSRLLQLGRTLAVVRTEVTGDTRRPVLEMVTSHAFPPMA